MADISLHPQPRRPAQSSLAVDHRSVHTLCASTPYSKSCFLPFPPTGIPTESPNQPLECESLSPETPFQGMQSVTLGHQRSNSESWLTSPSPGPQPGGPAQSSLPWVTDPSTPLRPAATTPRSQPQFSSSVPSGRGATFTCQSITLLSKAAAELKPESLTQSPPGSEPNDAHLTPHILPGTPSQAPPHSQSRPAELHCYN